MNCEKANTKKNSRICKLSHKSATIDFNLPLSFDYSFLFCYFAALSGSVCKFYYLFQHERAFSLDWISKEECFWSPLCVPHATLYTHMFLNTRERERENREELIIRKTSETLTVTRMAWTMSHNYHFSPLRDVAIITRVVARRVAIWLISETIFASPTSFKNILA